MELNPRQQKLAFALIVVVLAVVGVYLILPSAMGSRRPSSASTPATSATPAAPGSTLPAPSAAPSGEPSAASPSAVPAPSPTGQVNIYQWLPFSQSDLASAASVVTKFSAYFDTFSYTDSAKAYTGRMAGLVTSQFAATLEADFSTYGVARQRIQDKEVSSATAAIKALRSFGPSSMTFVVTIDQKTNLAARSPAAQQWAVTVTRAAGGWQVSDIQPATAGNS